MRYVLSYTFLFFQLCNYTLAQNIIWQKNFDMPEINMNYATGITGKAWNLGATAYFRKPVNDPNPLEYFTGSFSVICWVKAPVTARKQYVFFSSTDSSATSLNNNGWVMGMQMNGAWYCRIGENDTTLYEYLPAIQRINDGQWHQTGFTWNVEKKKITFYFDGRLKGIYHAPDLKKIMTRRIQAGGLTYGYLGEWETFNGWLDEMKLTDQLLPASYFADNYSSLIKTRGPKITTTPSSSFVVMNYNIFHGGNETGKEVGLQRIIEVIKASKADIITMQETYGSGAAIADVLGYYFYLPSDNLSIMSRFPIVETLPGGKPFCNGGALLHLGSDRKLAVYVNWHPYPVDYWDVFEKNKKIDSAWWYRQQDTVNAGTLRNSLAAMGNMLQTTDKVPIIFAGDLNTGSHLDWIESTRQLNNGYVMPFPTTQLLAASGFIDTYRLLHPNPLQHRGITWSPQVPKAFKDRIDYIFYKSPRIKPITSKVIETHPVRYPSDHAAVVTTFKWVY